MNYRTIPNCLLAGWLACHVLSNSSYAAATGIEAIQPLIDSQTYAVLAVHPDHVNIKATIDKVLQWVNEFDQEKLPAADVSKEAAKTQAELEKWVQDFHKAGGRQMYLVANAVDGVQFVLAVSMNKGGNREALEKQMAPVLQMPLFKGYETQMKGDCLIMGRSNSLARILQSNPVDRPDLSQALDATAPCGFGLALALAPDQKRVIQEMLPTLTIKDAQISTAPLTKSVNWASVGLSLPPETTLKMIFQTPGEADVKALNETMQAVFLALPNLTRDRAAQRSIDGLFSRLKAQMDGSRLTYNLDAASLERIVMQQLLPALAQGKNKAQVVRNINSAKQIMLGCRMYESDNKKWPDNLMVLAAKGSYLGREVLKTADHPELEVGFEYLIPGPNNAKFPPSEHIVIYEKYTTWPQSGISVGMMDGSVQWMKDKAAFEKMLAATKERNAGK